MSAYSEFLRGAKKPPLDLFEQSEANERNLYNSKSRKHPADMLFCTTQFVEMNLQSFLPLCIVVTLNKLLNYQFAPVRKTIEYLLKNRI